MNFQRIIFYPSLLNPFAYLAIILQLLQVLIFEWWSKERDGKYYIYKINKGKFYEEFFREFITTVASVACNTFWFDRDRALYYRYYLRDKWFPYSKDKESRDYLNKRNYDSYLKYGKKTKV